MTPHTICVSVVGCDRLMVGATTSQHGATMRNYWEFSEAHRQFSDEKGDHVVVIVYIAEGLSY